ncbi:MAG: trp operon repressor [Rickettsiales bacterium]|jgi:uncharacterized protein YerC|nr:trp operon repressor [Rickettsiales bacterium]
MNLYHAFSAIKSEKEFFNFLRDILTPTEIREISARWNIAQSLVLTPESQPRIAARFNCGRATITRVSHKIYEEKNNGYKTVIQRLHPHADFNKNIKKLKQN